MDVKRLNPEEEEDRISDLPDCIIHHILSFLPSTKEAIRTDILSKRWKNQWTRVPVLIFNADTSGMSSNRSNKKFLRFIDNTLHLYDCSKIKKLQLCYAFGEDHEFTSKLEFATKKRVEELTLNCYYKWYMLPEFLLDNSSLVKLKMFYCCFSIDWSINWPSLKTLEIVGWCSTESPYIGRLIISGCPLLESFEFRKYSGRRYGDGDVIASKSLKKLILEDILIDYPMKISCPNLNELVIDRHKYYGLANSMIEISCPNLESVELHGLNYGLVNCPSLVYANLDFEIEDGENVPLLNLGQLQHVKELTVRSWFFTDILSEMEEEDPVFHNKILNLHLTNYDHFPSIECALRSSPALERLVITLPPYEGRRADFLDFIEPQWNLNDCGENYWNSNGTDFNCLVSHLKFVKISGLCKREPKSKLVINFIEFLLNKARVLEKLVVVIGKREDFMFKVSQKVSSFPRCSKHATIEFLCS